VAGKSATREGTVRADKRYGHDIVEQWLQQQAAAEAERPWWRSTDEKHLVNRRRRLAVAGIRFYQRHLQPAQGCWYEPYCSDYGITAIEKHGIRQGLILLAERIQRCTAEGRKEFHANHACTGCAARRHDPCE
jgi:putative component of membrane protein insertase Oxa1/YidC/SpoIIIJ protein YidD